MSIDSLTGFKAMCGCFTGLTVITVALRSVARKKNEVSLKADDWLMVAATVFFLGNMTSVYLLARVNFSGYNGGHSSNEVDVFVQQVTFAFQLLIVWTLGAAKASVLFFYRRIFCQHQQMNISFRVAIVVTLVINACWVVGFFLLGLFECGTHLSFGGNHFAYCTLINQYEQGFYISDIILDVWIMIMPIPHIIRLKMNQLKKWLTVIVFLLSFVGLGASIARLVNYMQTPRINPGAVHHMREGGSMRTRSAWTTYIWFGTLEMGTAIVAINMPTLYNLFTKGVPEGFLRVKRSCASMASHAFSASATSTVNHEQKAETWAQNFKQLELQASNAGNQTPLGVGIGRALSTDILWTDQLYVHEIMQASPERSHEQV